MGFPSVEVTRDLHREQVSSENKFVEKTAAATLKLHEQLVFCTANTATDDYTLTLPPVSQAAGLSFYIYATIANAKAVTVQDNNDDAGMDDIALDTDADDVLLYSTGKQWIQLYNGIT